MTATDTDDVRRYETDATRDHDDEPDTTWMDEHGMDRTPGHWPSPIAGI